MSDDTSRQTALPIPEPRENRDQSARDELIRQRSRRYEIIADLSKTALSETDLEELTDMAVRKVARLLNVEFVEMLELRQDGEHLTLCAGVGWDDDFTEMAPTHVDEDYPACLALRMQDLVVVENLHMDERFTQPTTLAPYGVTSGICVNLHSESKPYGVLGVYSREQRSFDYDEIFFLQSAANVIGTAMARFRANELGRQLARRRRNMNEELETQISRKTQQVRKLASDLTRVEQRERHRIARVLHDDVQQLLYGAQLQLHMGMDAVRGNDSAMDKLKTVDELLLEAIDKTRTLTVELSPPILEGEGLVNALEWLASQLHKMHELNVSIDAVGWTEIRDEEIRQLVFQCVRELLFNVVKHADAQSARVQLKADGMSYRIRVQDDGNGYEVDDANSGHMVSTGFGLTRIKDRLGLFGGRLEMKSSPGSGTRAEIVLPFKMNEESRLNK